MQIDLNSMDKSKKAYKVYSHMWSDDSRIPGKTCKTYYPKSKRDSNNSYSFEISGLSSEYLTTAKKLSREDKETIADQLISIFKVNDEEKENFKNKLIDACSGSGREGAKITTLHSSSLCAFLFFYNVSRDNRLSLEIEGKNIEFDEVFFEYQNEVIEGRNPSNVDVVLTGKDCEDKDIILFLESKFSEYLSGGQANIAQEYLNQYPNIYNNPEDKPQKQTILDKIGFEFKKNKNEENESFKHQIKIYNKTEEVYKIGPKKGSAYSEGIKQMISHYIGIENYLNKPDERCDSRIMPKDAKVYLAEIMFEFPFQKAKEQLANYTNYYKDLAKELNKLNENIHVCEEPLKYSLFIDKDFVNSTIKNFYFGELGIK